MAVISSVEPSRTRLVAGLVPLVQDVLKVSLTVRNYVPAP